MINFNTIKPLSKQSNKKFCIYAMGGLGDTIKKYLGSGHHGVGWEYINSIKSKHPDSIIKLVVMSSNPQASQFYVDHPLIDCIIEGPWTHENWLHTEQSKTILNELEKDRINNGYVLVDYENSAIKQYSVQQQTDFYFGEDENDKIKEIKELGDYVLLHPFSSNQSRTIMPVEEYFPLVNKIAELGLNIVVVGANWTKIRTQYSVPVNIKEEFNYEHKNLINLIDKVNSKIAVGLAVNAKHLVTVRSFCFSTTKSGKTDCTLLVSDPKSKPPRKYFTPKEAYSNLRENKFGWSEKAIKRINIIGGDYDYKLTRDEILKSVKRSLK